MKNILLFVLALGIISCSNSQDKGFDCSNLYDILSKELKLKQRENVNVTFIENLSELTIKDLKYIYPEIDQKIKSSTIDIKKECGENVKKLKRQRDNHSKETFSISYPIRMENNHALILVNYHASPKSAYDQLFSFRFKDEHWYLEKRKTLSVY